MRIICYCNYDFFPLLLHYPQVSHSSTFPHSSPTSARRTTMSPVKGRRVEGRTAVTSRTSGRGRAAATTRTQSAVPCPPRSPQEKPKVTKSQEKDDYAGFCSFSSHLTACLFRLEMGKWTSVVYVSFTELGMTVSSGLVASVQSLVAVLQQQVDTSGHQFPADSQKSTPGHHPPKDNVMYKLYLQLLKSLTVQLFFVWSHDLRQFD